MLMFSSVSSWVMELSNFRTLGLKMEMDYETIREGPFGPAEFLGQQGQKDLGMLVAKMCSFLEAIVDDNKQLQGGRFLW